MIIIYKTVNKINNKIYVGVHKTLKELDNYLGSGSKLLKSIKEFGKENFIRETLEIVTEDNWREREKYWIEQLDSRNPNVGYNINEGGGDYPRLSGKDSWWSNATNEQREKHKNSVKKNHHDMNGKNNPMFGIKRIINKEWKERLVLNSSKKISINGVTYRNIKIASKELKIYYETLRYRLKSNNKKWEEYKYV